jgi:hypothetical protein
MTKYFELRDDMYLPDRWHLDDPETDEGCDPYDFRRGVPMRVRSTPNVAIKVPGVPLDLTLTLLDVPVATHRVAEVLSKVAGADVQRIPATVGSRAGYEIINVCRLIRCLDERLTTSFTKWGLEDERPDRLGRYRNVTNLMIDPQLVPPSTHLFRIEGWDIPIIASSKVMEALLSIGAVGPKFTPVS